MKKDFLGIFAAAAFALFSTALLASDGSAPPAGDDPGSVLFEVGNEKVSLDEFEYVYRKNNPTKQNDYSRASLEEYLELYINFKLKVKEARTLRIDTLPAVQSELDRYRKQLVKSYFDKAVTDNMTAEAYDRMLLEIDAHHIMVTVQPGAAPADTLAAWNKIVAIQQRLAKGEDFGKVAAEASEDPSAKENKGNIGYVTGLQIPDARFEDALFNTAKGKVSAPVRTRYGFHLVKPGERRSNRGTVQVAHMLIKFSKEAGSESREAALKRANELRDMIRNGASFDSLVALNSDDKTTASKGGVLEPFSTGKMVGSFEEASFALQNAGDVSEPVETTYGFHLIKLVERTPLAGYDDMKAEVLRRLQRAGRYDEARASYISNAQGSYGFKENAAVLDAFKASMDSSILVNTWRSAKAVNTSAVLFQLGDVAYKVDDFAFHVERSQRAYRDQDIAAKIDRLYQQYVEDNTVEYALGRKDEAFRRLLQEYRDGILLFELTEEKVWQQAMRDTVGLQNFYEQTRNNYLWDERVEAVVYTIQDGKTAKKVRKSLQGGATADEVLAKYNTDDNKKVVSSEHGLYLPEQNSFVDQAGRSVGISANLMTNESGNTVLVQILQLVPSEPKTLDQAKGYVISDYQEFLEDRWVEELRAKYPVVIHQETFQSMIR